MMRISIFATTITGLVIMAIFSNSAIAQKIVVAHRGASGYLPEHTLEAKAMAYAMGADYLEQDVVMSRDDQLIVLHDITLDRTTNVADIYPGRARDDGRHYVIDFTLAEIRTLAVREGVRDTGEAIYPQRFPVAKSSFRINTLAEEIELIQGLNESTGRDVGVYPEVKAPAFHRAEGKDLSRAIINELKAYGYTDKQDRVYLQTFEFDELKLIHDQIMPALGVDIRLVQLIADDEDFHWMLDEIGMATLASVADGIGPDKAMIMPSSASRSEINTEGLVALAHANDLEVHPYTFRLDDGQIPAYAENFEDLLQVFYFDIGVDGLFTDFPDRAVTFLRAQNNRE